MHGINIALTKLAGASIQNINGAECVCIPVEENNIFVTNRGQAYLSLNMYPYEEGEGKNNNTHFLKRNKPKNVSREAYQNYPVVGYAKEFGDNKPKHYNRNNCQQRSYNAPAPSGADMGNPTEDLPF